MAFQVSLEKCSNRPTVDCDTRCSSFVLSPFSPICSSASVLSDAAAQDSYKSVALWLGHGDLQAQIPKCTHAASPFRGGVPDVISSQTSQYSLLGPLCYPRESYRDYRFHDSAIGYSDIQGPNLAATNTRYAQANLPRCRIPTRFTVSASNPGHALSFPWFYKASPSKLPLNVTHLESDTPPTASPLEQTRHA